MAATELQQQAPQQIWRKQVSQRIGGVVLNVSATTGFAFLPGCSGVPVGTPAAGENAVVIDQANHRLYFYSGGSWRNAGP